MDESTLSSVSITNHLKSCVITGRLITLPLTREHLFSCSFTDYTYDTCNDGSSDHTYNFMLAETAKKCWTFRGLNPGPYTTKDLSFHCRPAKHTRYHCAKRPCLVLFRMLFQFCYRVGADAGGNVRIGGNDEPPFVPPPQGEEKRRTSC